MGLGALVHQPFHSEAVVQNPHDRLFKHVFSKPEQAAEELRSVLPEPIARRIDWSTLHPLPVCRSSDFSPKK
jgi:hypothetical protein